MRRKIHTPIPAHTPPRIVQISGADQMAGVQPIFEE